MGILDLVTKGFKVEPKQPKQKREKKSVKDDDARAQPSLDATTNSAPINTLEVAPATEQNIFENYSPSYSAQQQLFPSSEPAQGFDFGNSFAGALGGATLGNRNILIITPKSSADISQIINNLKSGEACIVRLEPLEPEQRLRNLDFLNGVTCAIGGQMKELSEHTFVLAPNGLGVRN